jgi:hypothetical protein
MTSAQISRFTALACFILFMDIGYGWGSKSPYTGGSTRLYHQIGLDAGGVARVGFSCKCQTNPVTNQTSWIGASVTSDTSCEAGTAKDYPWTLAAAGYVIDGGTQTIPAHACCRNKPKIGTKIYVNRDDTSCLLGPT